MKTPAPISSLSLEAHRALVEAGYAPIDEYLERVERESGRPQRPATLAGKQKPALHAATG